MVKNGFHATAGSENTIGGKLRQPGITKEDRKKMGNTIDFINTLNKDTVGTFRKLAAIAFEDNTLKGKIVTVYTGGTEEKKEILTGTNTVYGLKFIAIQENKKTIGSSMLVRASSGDKSPLDLAIPMHIHNAIPDGIATGRDGHLRWRTSAPTIKGKGDLYNYLIHEDQCMVLDPKTLALDSKATDIQVVYVGGFYHIHVLTEKGCVYEAKVPPREVRTNGRIPQFHKLSLSNITTILTAPHKKGELIAFFGTKNNGVYFGNQQVPGTNNLNIVDIIVDSEQPRIFFTTEQGKIFRLRLDGNFMINGDLATVAATMVPGERIFAGPTITSSETESGLLAIQWLQQGNGFQYKERVIPVPEIISTINTPIPCF